MRETGCHLCLLSSTESSGEVVSSVFAPTDP